jgi:ankyrin repeat protein
VIYNNHDSISIANLLVSSGSNLNYQNVNGYTALMVGKLKSLDHKLKIVYYFYIFSACKFNSINIVNILKAVHYNQVSTAKYLLSMGCNVNLVDSFGYTALKWGYLMSNY